MRKSSHCRNCPVLRAGITLVLLLIMAGSIWGQSCTCGDVNGDSQANVGDIVYMIAYVFRSGPPPQFTCDGDVNGDNGLDVGDAVYMINWVFREGPPPACSAGGGATAATDCKLFEKITAAEDCLSYQYDGMGLLTMTHVNAAFNCCPGQIMAEISLEGDTIVITESETESACDCICLFDVDMEMHYLPPGQYTILVNEPYVNSGQISLTFTVDFSSPATGQFCVPRSTYPWTLLGAAGGSMTGHSDCLLYSKEGQTLPDPDLHADCIEFEYDGSGILDVHHLNSAFNCCPLEMLADFTFDGSTIIITESEVVDPPCVCLCLFDVDYQLTGIPPGVYLLRILGLNLGGGGPVEMIINLATDLTGSHCVERDYYPWDLP